VGCVNGDAEKPEMRTWHFGAGDVARLFRIRAKPDLCTATLDLENQVCSVEVIDEHHPLLYLNLAGTTRQNKKGF
jgi:hypothetical protein